MMKMIAVLPSALLVSALLGCSQQASTAPLATRTAQAPETQAPAASTETNTFGESMDKTASNAARAREENYGSASSGSSSPK